MTSPQTIARPSQSRGKYTVNGFDRLRKILRWRGLLPSFLLIIATISFWPDRNIAADAVQSDAPNYIVPCLNFIAGKGMLLIVNGAKYPPYHPFGLSLLMAPFYLLLGHNPGNGVYVMFISVLATVLLLYFVGKRLFGTEAAFVACLFLCASETFDTFSKTIWPDIPSACLCLAIFALVLIILDNPKSSLWLWLALGHAIGYAMMIRPDNGMILLPTGALIVWRWRSQQKMLQKTLLATSGVAFWLVVFAVVTFRYTGDVFRTQMNVMISGYVDRPDHGLSLRFLFKSPLSDPPLHQLFHTVRYQWSLVDTADPIKRMFLYVTDLFFIIGLIQCIRLAKSKQRVRQFLVWAGIWVVVCILFVGCSVFGFEHRYMQRVVPFLCLINGLGVVGGWTLLLKLWLPFRRMLNAISLKTHRRLLAYGLMMQFRFLLLAGFVAGLIWMMLRPIIIVPKAALPTTAYLKHAAALIAEDNAILISNFNPLYSAYFFGVSDQWMMLPLDRTAAGYEYVQWKKPPHPEWIVEDFTGVAPFTYSRMFENGAEYLYRQTAADNLEFLESAINSGRAAYIVCAGVYTVENFQTMGILANHFSLRLIELGFEKTQLPRQISEEAKNWFIGQLVEKGKNLGNPVIINTSDGSVQFEP